MAFAGLAAQTTAQGVGDALGAQLAGSALAAVVVVAALVAAVWVGRRLRAEASRGLEAQTVAPDGPSELTSRHVFRVLQERNIASVEAIAAMSPRERQLLFDAVARKVTPVVGLPSVAAAGAPLAVAAAQPAHDAAIGALHCPACGAALAAASAAPRVVAPCERCGRRVSARRDGLRVSVTVDDPPGGPAAVASRPRRPSGGGQAPRDRS